MATYLSGNVRKATPNTVAAMRRSAENRRCPNCDRKSAMGAEQHNDDDPWCTTRERVCRWCGYTVTWRRTRGENGTWKAEHIKQWPDGRTEIKTY